MTGCKPKTCSAVRCLCFGSTSTCSPPSLQSSQRIKTYDFMICSAQLISSANPELQAEQHSDGESFECIKPLAWTITDYVCALGSTCLRLLSEICGRDVCLYHMLMCPSRKQSMHTAMMQITVLHNVFALPSHASETKLAPADARRDAASVSTQTLSQSLCVHHKGSCDKPNLRAWKLHKEDGIGVPA